jgi:hypothetical protein
MANRSTDDVVTKPATDTAAHLEKSVRTNDKQGYDNAMAEVNKYRDTHTPDENKAYTAAITKKLEDDKVLPSVALYEAQSSFKKMDTSGNGKLEKGELDQFANRRDVNDLQRNLIGNIQQNYDKIRDINQYGERWYGGNSNQITQKDIDAGVKESQAQMNLYAPDKAGKSLVERLVDKDGNIPAGTIKELRALEEKHPGQYLSPEDKKTLDDIDAKRTWASRIPFRDDVSKDKLKEMAVDGGNNQALLEQQPRKSRVETPVAPPENATPHQKEMAKEAVKEQSQAEAKTKERDEKIAEALKVKPHESYAHSAERLLVLAGKSDFTGKELREVSHQLWLADHQRKKNELHAGQSLTLDDNVKKTPALAKLFAPEES